MNRIRVKENVLRWAIERSSLTPNALDRKVPEIHLWLSGERLPTLRQLERLAKATYTPLGYFFLSKPPEERSPIPHFRTVRGEPACRPSADFLETVQTMQRRQEWMHDFLIDEGQEPLPFVKSGRTTDEPSHVAHDIRRVLGLKEKWAAEQPTWTDALRRLQTAMEEAGILVVVNGIVGNNSHRKLNVKEFRGFVLVDEYAPLVFVNNADAKAAQMFTLAHELAHVWFGSSASFDLRKLLPADDGMEQVCDRVAAEFLIPEHELRQIWPSIRQDPRPFQTIARRFKVSELVVARRALDVGLIQKSKFFEFYREYQESLHAIAPSPGGGNFWANQELRIGRRFADAVVRAVKDGKLLYYEAYQLTGLYGETFEKFAKLLEPGGTT